MGYSFTKILRYGSRLTMEGVRLSLGYFRLEILLNILRGISRVKDSFVSLT